MQHKAVLKGTRWLLLKNAENLDEEKDEKSRLKEARKLNEPLATAYYLKEWTLRRFWEQPGEAIRHDVPGRLGSDGRRRRGSRSCNRWLRHWRAHRSGLLAYYDVMISSGPMEGTKQQDQDDEAAGVWVPRWEFFQAEDPARDP